MERDTTVAMWTSAELKAIGAAEVELAREDVREIESAASGITVQGARYPEHLERLGYRQR